MSKIAHESNGVRHCLDIIRSINPRNILSEGVRFKYNLPDLKKNGLLKYDNRTFKVVSISLYTEVNKHWKIKANAPYIITELVLCDLSTGKVWYMDWSIDDEIEISLSIKKLGRSEISGITYDDNEAVDISDIDEICEEEESLYCGGCIFEYSDDVDMVYKPDNGDSVYLNVAEFEGEDELWLTVESWSSSPEDDDSWEYDIWISKTINPAGIEVLALGEQQYEFYCVYRSISQFATIESY